MKKWLKLQTYLLSALPVVIFFSYYPVIPLGSTATMNFELSLPLIWLALFSLLSLPTLPQSIRQLKLQPWQLGLLALFPLYLLCSLLWTGNFWRGFLTAGIFGCLCLSALTIPRLITNKTIKSRLVKIFLTASTLVAVYCWLQSIADVAGLSSAYTLACQGCTTNTFGFPHPNGFAIEPQFMGNLLLAPALLSLYLFFHRSKHRAKFLALGLFLSTTLFFTFSRGATYAYLLACAVILITELIRRRRQALLIVPIILSSLLLCLTFQGIFATLSPTSDNFWSGVTKSLHHLTLGRLDLRPTTPTPSDADEDTPSDSPTSTFSGYVAESTNVRLSLTGIALDTWRQTPASLLFGVGVGGSGVAMYQAHPELGSAKEITQNQYVEILLEFGLLGAAFLLLAVFLILKKVAPLHLYATALLLAYAFTLFFFSGLPNALHLYLLPPLFLHQKPTVRKS